MKHHHSEPNLITGDATEYSKHLFRVLDTDKDNMVSWREVMVGFHQLSPSGDPDQKLKLVYSVSTYNSTIVSVDWIEVLGFSAIFNIFCATTFWIFFDIFDDLWLL